MLASQSKGYTYLQLSTPIYTQNWMATEKGKQALCQFKSAQQSFAETIDFVVLHSDDRGERDEVVFLRVHRISAVKCSSEKFARGEAIL